MRWAPGGTDLQGKWPLMSAGSGAPGALWRGAARWRRRACGRPVALGREEGEADSASRTHTGGPPGLLPRRREGPRRRQARLRPVLLELKTGREHGVRAVSPARPAPFCNLVLQHLKPTRACWWTVSPSYFDLLRERVVLGASVNRCVWWGRKQSLLTGFA